MIGYGSQYWYETKSLGFKMGNRDQGQQVVGKDNTTVLYDTIDDK